MTERGLVLLTGASGYVGGKLLSRLERNGRRVRCLVRKPEDFHQATKPSTEVNAGDVLDSTTLGAAMRGASAAYYLIHSMGSGDSFEDTDRDAARNFGEAARAAGVGRIIYLGGLGSDREELSAHLRSRHEVGEILRESGVPVLEFRASIVIGSGSLSYEMIRALVQRLPVMVTPKWVKVPAQPIAISDLLDYLAAGLDIAMNGSKIYEIGGEDIISYEGMMKVFARQRGLHRVMIPVPVLTPYLSSLWLELVTPVYARIGRKLIESIIHPTVVRDRSALSDFSVRPIGVEDAMRGAIADDDAKKAGTNQ
ncbi:MAG: NAD(P)H-binding protein [Gemmatimonadota bacterium]|nr:NAD(P)H-binding protein [Gemmatimonadota bacterium]